MHAWFLFQDCEASDGKSSDYLSPPCYLSVWLKGTDAADYSESPAPQLQSSHAASLCLASSFVVLRSALLGDRVSLGTLAGL